MKRLALLVLFVVSQMGSLAQDVMYLNIAAIGMSMQSTQSLLVVRSSNAVAPTKVILEAKSGILTGAILEYPKAITKEHIRESLNADFSQSEVKFSSKEVYTWRDKVNRVSMIVGTDNGTSSLIIRSIDRAVLNGRPK